MLTIAMVPEALIWAVSPALTITDVLDMMTQELLPKGTVIKLDRLFFERHPDKSFIRTCQEKGYPVFVDAKIIDNPEEALAIAATYLQYRPFMLSIMGASCTTSIWESKSIENIDTLKRFADACARVETKSCVVAFPSEKSNVVCKAEYNRWSHTQLSYYASMGRSAGCTDIVYPASLGIYNGFEASEASALFSTGVVGIDVNISGLSLSDERHRPTPAKAFKFGAKRVILEDELFGDDMKKVYKEIAQTVVEGAAS